MSFVKQTMKVRIAILDMNEAHENQGMRCIKEIINQWSEIHNYQLFYEVFDVRCKLEIPSLDFDVFISSGGPGSPLASEGTEWENAFFDFIGDVEKWNTDMVNYPKKHFFFICHSFQLVCRYYQIAKVCKRKSTAFGVFPVHMLEDGKNEIVFGGLCDPFYAVESRDYQVIQPNHNRLKQLGAKILAIEKNRPHVPYERAVEAIRFNEYFIGTQFHPEADATGMSMYLQRDDKKKIVIENHGQQKWESMMEQLNDPDKILYTQMHILPNFLNNAVEQLVLA